MPDRYEVGRFGLRTFKVHSGKLHSVIASGSGQHWDQGECRARCVVFEDIAFASDAVWKRRQVLAESDLALRELNKNKSLFDRGTFQRLTEEIEEAKNEMLEMLEHEAPDIDCRCGVYGSLNLENLRRQYAEALFMVAVIAAEGKTIIGTRGLRTEYARVVAFWTPWYQFFMRRVAVKECPDATSYKDLNLMLKDYGIPRKADGSIEPIKNASTWWLA